VDRGVKGHAALCAVFAAVAPQPAVLIECGVCEQQTAERARLISSLGVAGACGPKGDRGWGGELPGWLAERKTRPKVIADYRREGP